MIRNKILVAPVVAFALSFFANPSIARADFVTLSGSGPSGLSASVTFATMGDSLVVVLTNTASMDVTSSSQVLTGVWFNAPGELTPLFALLNLGSDINNDWDIPFVGGEWAYKGDLNMSWGANSGISAVSLGIFGAGDRFVGPDLDPPADPAGLNYGITTDGDNPNTGPSTPLIENSVVFILAGWCSEWSLSDITNVYFQYGVSLNSPRFAASAVPEPGVLALVGLGLIGLAFGVRKLSWA